jgi:hypothetical protein
VTPAELGGLAKDLVAAAPALGALVPTQQTLAHQIDPVSRCLSKVIFPGGDVPLSDGTRSTGVRNYQEFWYGLVGLNGVGSAFDGNGSFQRLLLGGGGQSFTTGPVKIYGTSDKGTSQETLQGRETEPSEGTSPAAPAAEPPVKSNVACATQSLPDYNGPASHGAADRSAAGRRPSSPSSRCLSYRRSSGGTSSPRRG